MALRKSLMKMVLEGIILNVPMTMRTMEMGQTQFILAFTASKASKSQLTVCPIALTAMKLELPLVSFDCFLRVLSIG